MKRDMELVRKILLYLEEDDEPSKWKTITIKGYGANNISHHLKILYEAGLIEAKNISTKDINIWQAKSLTWDGHELLDSIKNHTVWNRTKEGIKEKGFELGNIPIDILKEYAKIQFKQLFGLE